METQNSSQNLTEKYVTVLVPGKRYRLRRDTTPFGIEHTEYTGIVDYLNRDEGALLNLTDDNKTYDNLRRWIHGLSTVHTQIVEFNTPSKKRVRAVCEDFVEVEHE